MKEKDCWVVDRHQINDLISIQYLAKIENEYCYLVEVTTILLCHLVLPSYLHFSMFNLHLYGQWFSLFILSFWLDQAIVLILDIMRWISIRNVIQCLIQCNDKYNMYPQNYVANWKNIVYNVTIPLWLANQNNYLFQCKEVATLQTAEQWPFWSISKQMALHDAVYNKNLFFHWILSMHQILFHPYH